MTNQAKILLRKYNSNARDVLMFEKRIQYYLRLDWAEID